MNFSGFAVIGLCDLRLQYRRTVQWTESTQQIQEPERSEVVTFSPRQPRFPSMGQPQTPSDAGIHLR